ncbi:hypothetical protein ACP4J4_01755 [Aureimonas ureilytica]|uniref:hypothetical protein n=1 Tax=Aureimonas ureilytica TaxID=401562 RepID=UPI003CEB590F
MEQFEVVREHLGDRLYAAGEVREAKEADVVHLVRNGVLRVAGEKGAPAPANKAAPAPANKAAPIPANKSKV